MNIFPMLDTITDRRSGVTESVEHLVAIHSTEQLHPCFTIISHRW